MENKKFFLRLHVGLYKKQHGVSVIVILVLLVAILILGVSAAQVSLLSGQSTRNMRDYRIAHEAAQAALVDAVMDIEGNQRKTSFTGGSIGFIDGCGSGNYLGLCAPTDQLESKKPVVFEVDMRTSNKVVPYGKFTGRTFASGVNGLEPAKPPAYIIENIDVDPKVGGLGSDAEPKFKYRISAIGYGPVDSVYVILQSEYKK